MNKNFYKKVKRHVTLIEMMIVMFLIAMIIGVVAYNYQGSLEEGKAFKTKIAKEKLSTILTIAVANNPDIADRLEEDWIKVVLNSPLIQNPKDVTKDGWGNTFDISYEDDKLVIRSNRYEEYLKKHPDSAYDDKFQQ